MPKSAFPFCINPIAQGISNGQKGFLCPSLSQAPALQGDNAWLLSARQDETGIALTFCTRKTRLPAQRCGIAASLQCRAAACAAPAPAPQPPTSQADQNYTKGCVKSAYEYGRQHGIAPGQCLTLGHGYWQRLVWKVHRRHCRSCCTALPPNLHQARCTAC